MKVTCLKCMKCGKEYPDNPARYVCDDCGTEGILDVVYDYNSVKVTKEEIAASKDYSLWRYAKMLPVKDASMRAPLQVGWTPLYKATKVEKEFGLNNVYI